MISKTREQLTAAERKSHPLYTGLMKYFPNALMEVAHLSKVGNDQHNPGQPLHWAKEKSMDEGDALMRHQVDAGTRDTDGERHSAKVAWRALAQLEREILAEQAGMTVEQFNASLAQREDKLPDGYVKSTETVTGPKEEVIALYKRQAENAMIADCIRTGGEWRNGNCYTKTVYHGPIPPKTEAEQGDFGELIWENTGFTPKPPYPEYE